MDGTFEWHFWKQPLTLLLFYQWTCGGQMTTFRSPSFPFTVGSRDQTQVVRLVRLELFPTRPTHQPQNSTEMRGEKNELFGVDMYFLWLLFQWYKHLFRRCNYIGKLSHLHWNRNLSILGFIASFWNESALLEETFKQFSDIPYRIKTWSRKPATYPLVDN